MFKVKLNLCVNIVAYTPINAYKVYYNNKPSFVLVNQ